MSVDNILDQDWSQVIHDNQDLITTTSELQPGQLIFDIETDMFNATFKFRGMLVISAMKIPGTFASRVLVIVDDELKEYVYSSSYLFLALDTGEI